MPATITAAWSCYCHAIYSELTFAVAMNDPHHLIRMCLAYLIIKNKEKETWGFSPVLLHPRQRDVNVTWPGAIANKFSLISDISPRFMTLGCPNCNCVK